MLFLINITILGVWLAVQEAHLSSGAETLQQSQNVRLLRRRSGTYIYMIHAQPNTLEVSL